MSTIDKINIGGVDHNIVAAADLDLYETSTTTPTDNELVVTKESSGWKRKTISKIWDYIKSKLGISSSGSTGKYLNEQGSFATPPNDNTTYTFATGDSNGQIKVTPSGGTAQNVSVKGLGSLAYKSSLTASDVGALASTTKYATSDSVGGSANTVRGSYSGSGGQQAPNYFGTNKVGFLMSNVSINSDSHYKNIMYMDCYNGNDVGGTTALALDRMEAKGFILQADKNRSSWNNSAELITTKNIGSQSVNYATSASSATTSTTASALADNGWKEGLINSQNATYYKKVGNIVFIHIEYSGFITAQTWTTYFTLASGYRPSKTINNSYTCSGTGNVLGLVRVQTNGVVYLFAGGTAGTNVLYGWGEISFAV